MGKSSINEPFSMAMLNNQMVFGDFWRYDLDRNSYSDVAMTWKVPQELAIAFGTS